jgi:hypothetical protein
MHQVLFLSVQYLNILYTFCLESRKIIYICEECFLCKQDNHQPFALDIKYKTLLHVSASVCSQLKGVLALKDIYSLTAQHDSNSRW